MDANTRRELTSVIGDIRSGRYQQACKTLEELVGKGSKHPEVIGLLGTVKMELGDFDEAVKSFEQLLLAHPNHVPTLYNMARALQMQGKNQDALKIYAKITSIDPNFFHAWNNLGLIYKETGDLVRAKEMMEKAVAIAPDHAPLLNNLGVVMEMLGELTKAKSLFERAVALKDNYFSARFNLGCLLFRLGSFKEAENHLLWVISQEKDEPTARFLLQAMGQMEEPRRAPVHYVQKTFDEWAEQFEYKLVNELEYKTPEKLFAFLKPHLKDDSHIMDLGCGTGLGADLYRPLASFLAGMDCSSKMLKKAKEKGIYDALYLHDIEKRWPLQQKFHVIYSADCLCYFGDLKVVFQRVRDALHPGGIFGFSVEKADTKEVGSKGFVLRRSSRYAHTRHYVEDCLKRVGLVPVTDREVTLRKEANSGVTGFLFCAKRA